MELDHVIRRLAWVDAFSIPLWIVLTALMAVAAIVVARKEGAILHRYTGYVLGLIGLVWLYPVYTGMRLVPGLFGSLTMVACTVAVMRKIGGRSRLAGHLIGPTLVWLGASIPYLVLKILAAP